MLIRNPKDGKEIETDLSEEQAATICSSLPNDFARKLAHQFKYGPKALSPSQYYWLFKLAEESKPIPPVQLATNLQEFISHAEMLQFRVELEDRTFGKVFLYTRQDCIDVCLGYRHVGKIIGDQLHPSKNCLPIVIAELLVMSINPFEWMCKYGKDTGQCCVCGALLTNEISVARGIGPICAQKWGY